MQDYKQIDIAIHSCQNEIERLKQVYEDLIATREKITEVELAEAVKKVIALGGQASIEPPKSTASSRSPSTGPKKYLNPETGVEWSGQGYMPDWILNGDKENFLNPAWTAHQAAKKKSKKTQTQPESEIEVLKQPLSVKTVKAINPLAEPVPMAEQAAQVTVLAVSTGLVKPSADPDSEKVTTE